MKTFHITKRRFLEWYYESGQDQENERLRLDLANKIIVQLVDKGKACISVEDLFSECNENAIRLCFLEEFKNVEDEERELSDLGIECAIKLID